MHNRIRAFIIFFAAVALLAVSFGCSSDNQSTDNAKDYNLIQLYDSARHFYDSGIISLDANLDDHFTPRNWSEPFDNPSGEGKLIAAIQRRTTFKYQAINSSDHWVRCTVSLKGMYGDLPSQRMVVTWKDEPLAVFEFDGSGPKEIEFKIPGDRINPGVNFVYFNFDQYLDNADFLKNRKKARRAGVNPGVAAYFTGFEVFKYGSNGPIAPKLAAGQRNFDALDGGKLLRQISDSELVYGFTFTPEDTLSIAGTVQTIRGGNASASVSVQYRREGDLEWQFLWSGQFNIEQGAPQQFEDTIVMEALADTNAELKFSVLNSNPEAEAVAVGWRNMRLKQGAVQPFVKRPEKINPPQEIKHVAIIIIDAARVHFMGSYGGEWGATPKIDAFAKTSVQFNNAIAPAPYTIATISSIFTGLDVESHGVRKVTEALPDELPNMAAYFNEKGYYTLSLAGTQFATRKFGATKPCDEVVYLRTEAAKKSGVSTMDMEAVDAALKTASESGKPVFVYAHYLPPHWPYLPPKEFQDIYVESDLIQDRRKRNYLKGTKRVEQDDPIAQELKLHYMNNMRYADHIVDETLSMLKKYDLYDDTLIIVTSDHGEAFGEHGNVSHNTTVFDDMVMVPFIVKAPGVGPAQVDQLVGLVDIFPTVMELLGSDRTRHEFDGRSIAPLLYGYPMEPTIYYSRAMGDNYEMCFRGNDFKYIYYSYKRDEFFDLAVDPDERINLVLQQSVMTTILRQRILELVKLGKVKRAGMGLDAELSEEDRDELRDLGYVN